MIKLTNVKTLPKRIMSVILCVTITLSMGIFALTQTAITADAALFSKIIGGKIGEIACGAVERGIAYGLNYASSAAQSEMGTQSAAYSAVELAKRIMLDPQGKKLGEIKASINELSTQMNEMNEELNASDTYIEGLLFEIAAEQHKEKYYNKADILSDFQSAYTGFYNNYDGLLDMMNLLTECDSADYEANEKKFESTYSDFVDYCMDIYNDTSNKYKFNFAKDASTFANAISPYNSNYKPDNYNALTGEVDGYLDYTDESQWGEVQDKSDTYFAAYMQCLSDEYPFQHQQYEHMIPQINYVAGLAAQYLDMYRVYAEIVSEELINEDPTLNNDKVNTLWNNYRENFFVVMRALSQMTSPYEYQLSTYMRGYDFDNTVEFNDQRFAENQFCPFTFSLPISHADDSTYDIDAIWDSYYEYYEDDYLGAEVFAAGNYWGAVPSDNSDGYSYLNKAGGDTDSYIVVPANSDSSSIPTAYAVRDNSQNSERLTGRDMIDLTFKSAAYDGLFFTGWNDSWGVSADYASLMTTSTSPAGFQLIHQGEELKALVNTAKYSKSGYDQYLTRFLYGEGMTGVGTNATKLLTDRIHWDPIEELFGNYDADYKWISLTTPLESVSLNKNDTEYFDTQDYKNTSSSNEEVLAIFSTQSPTVDFQMKDSNGGFDIEVIKEIDPFDPDMEPEEITDEVFAKTTLHCGTSLRIRIKPDEGKYIETLKLVSRNATEDLLFHDSDGSISKEDEELNRTLMKQQQFEILNQMDVDPKSTDGYYEYFVTVPYSSSYISIGTHNYDESERLYDVNLIDATETVDGKTKDICNIYNNSNVGIDSFTKAAGTKVVVQCVPQNGYECTGIKITDLQNNEVGTAEPISFASKNDAINTDCVYPISANASAFSFTMPSCSVNVTPLYTEANTVSLQQADAGTIQFVNTNISELVTPERTQMSFSEGKTVTVFADSKDEKHYLKSITAKGIKTFLDYELKPTIISQISSSKYCYTFTMPNEDVMITPVFAEFGDKYKVQINNTEHCIASFTNEGMSSASVGAFNEGETVALNVVVYDKYYDYSIKAVAMVDDSEIELVKDGDNYSFTMPKGNVEVTLSETTDMRTLTLKGNYVSGGYGTVDCSDGDYLDDNSRFIQLGSDVNIIMTTVNNDCFPTVKVTKESGETQENSFVNNEDGTYTCSFTMPSENVVVTIDAKEKYTVYLEHTNFTVQASFPEDVEVTSDSKYDMVKYAPGDTVTICTNVAEDDYPVFEMRDKDKNYIRDISTYISDDNELIFTMPDYNLYVQVYSKGSRSEVGLTCDTTKGKASISDNPDDEITSKYCVTYTDVTFSVEANEDYYTPSVKVYVKYPSGSTVNYDYSLVSQEGNIYTYKFYCAFATSPLTIEVYFNGEAPIEPDPLDEDENGNFIIRTYDDLCKMSANVNKGCEAYMNGSYIVVNDIECPKDAVFTPIGTESKNFMGTFNGGGFAISNLNIDAASSYQGLFGYVSGADIKNFTIDGNISCTVGDITGIGGVVGFATGKTNLSDILSSVDISNTDSLSVGCVGGVAGDIRHDTKVERVMYSGAINLTNCSDGIGGIAGYTDVASINNSASVGEITVSCNSKAPMVGGIVGHADSGLKALGNCYTYGEISVDGDRKNAGAMVGYADDSIYSLSILDNYYLDTLSVDAYGSSGSSYFTHIMTADQFASGEVTFLLNNSSSTKTTWYQNLDNGLTPDIYPILTNNGKNTVYRVNLATKTYSNIKTGKEPSILLGTDLRTYLRIEGFRGDYTTHIINGFGNVDNETKTITVYATVTEDTITEKLGVLWNQGNPVTTGKIELLGDYPKTTETSADFIRNKIEEPEIYTDGHGCIFFTIPEDRSTITVKVRYQKDPTDKSEFEATEYTMNVVTTTIKPERFAGVHMTSKLNVKDPDYEMWNDLMSAINEVKSDNDNNNVVPSIPAPSKDSNSSTSDQAPTLNTPDNGTVQTGDATNGIILLGILLAATALGFIYKRKYNKYL